MQKKFTINNKKVRDHCHFTGKYKGAAQNDCNMNYKISKSIPVAFHNGSKYDYHSIIKELAKEFEGQFECLGENTEKYITFSVPIKKHKLKFIDSFSTSLSSHVNSLSDERHSDKCTECKSCLDYMSVKDDQWNCIQQSCTQFIFKCLNCNKDHNKDFNNDLINRFSSTYKVCDGDINKIILLLRKGVYLYEYIDSWERLNETSLLNKENFYSILNMGDIRDIDHRHAKTVFKEYKINNLGDYHDLYVQSDTLLLADVFENFRNKCIETYKLDPAYFLSAPALTWKACLKKTEIELELLTDINMLLMIQDGIRGGLTPAIYKYAEANNKYTENYDKNKESSYLVYLDACFKNCQ